MHSAAGQFGDSMNSPVVEFAEACYDVSGRRLVGPLTFTVGEGETVVLLGESGSGKTTVLRMINHLLPVTQGDVRVQGTSTAKWDPVHLRRRIGYVIQEVGLLPHLTVARNVALVPLLERWPKQRRDQRTDELLELVGLPPVDYRDRNPHELSGGQRQRVGVARALAADPPILICDEAFGAVDPVTRGALRSEFRALTRRLRKTVVFVTHDVKEALTLADRIIVLKNGRIEFGGTIGQFQRDQTRLIAELRDLA
jgi:osmoprotectant transport system ATP-binding protein